MASAHKTIMNAVSSTLGDILADRGKQARIDWRFGWDDSHKINWSAPAYLWQLTGDTPVDSRHTQAGSTTAGSVDVIATYLFNFDIHCIGDDTRDDIPETEKMVENLYAAVYNALTGTANLVDGGVSWPSQVDDDFARNGIGNQRAIVSFGFRVEMLDEIQSLTTISSSCTGVTASFAVQQTTSSIPTFIDEPDVLIVRP